MNLSFSPVKKKHRELIRCWLHKEHVQPYFFGEGLKNTLKSLDLFVSGINRNEHHNFSHWVAYANDTPFGFLMTSSIEGPYNPDSNYDKWYIEGKDTITLDLLIGEEKFLGKGLAPRMIQEFLLDKFSHVSTVLIDPDIENTRAVHVYEKAGFRKMEQFIPSYNPVPHWMMRLHLKDISSDSSKL